MLLSSSHRMRNSSPGGLRPRMLPLGHGGSPQYWLSHVDGEETFFVSFKPPRPGTEPQLLAWKAAVLTTTLGPPPSQLLDDEHFKYRLERVHAQFSLIFSIEYNYILINNDIFTANEGLVVCRYGIPRLYLVCIIRLNPITAKLFNLNFSPTWSCVSLTRSPTPSEWKLFRFDKIEINTFQILLVDFTFYLYHI